jgi:hypothetical protein
MKVEVLVKEAPKPKFNIEVYDILHKYGYKVELANSKLRIFSVKKGWFKTYNRLGFISGANAFWYAEDTEEMRNMFKEIEPHLNLPSYDELTVWLIKDKSYDC